MLPTIVPIIRSTSASDGCVLSLAVMMSGDIGQSADGWHVLLRIGDVEHRMWLKQPPVADASYAAELVLDGDFESRSHAARRLWLALSGRPAGPTFQKLSPQRRQRLALALRALDARIGGNSYREIAQGLFGPSRVPERAWKSDDLRNRTIRLVRDGVALMRGGYRALLRQARRRK